MYQGGCGPLKKLYGRGGKKFRRDKKSTKETVQKKRTALPKNTLVRVRIRREQTHTCTHISLTTMPGNKSFYLSWKISSNFSFLYCYIVRWEKRQGSKRENAMGTLNKEGWNRNRCISRVSRYSGHALAKQGKGRGFCKLTEWRRRETIVGGNSLVKEQIDSRDRYTYRRKGSNTLPIRNRYP